MRIRTLTIFLEISKNDFDDDSLHKKLNLAATTLDITKRSLLTEGYEVQTTRIALNSFEDWLIEGTKSDIVAKIQKIYRILKELNVELCSFGGCKNTKNLDIIPIILSTSPGFAASFQSSQTSIFEDFLNVAKLCIDLSKISKLHNFGFCMSSNCPGNIPFFPVAYTESESHSHKQSISIGLECGDLIFLGLRGTSDYNTATHNLRDIIYQSLFPIQRILKKCIFENDLPVVYNGIDCSIAPGLALPESVGFGIEQIHPYKFGELGTLATISSITSALKTINELSSTRGNDFEPLKVVGYCGLMLPVMEDTILSQRANESEYSLRDLLLFSTVCGVGIDTVPIPGDVSATQLANLYLEIHTIAFRLNKPLSCRVLPMSGMKSGDLTDIDSPYLINTKSQLYSTSGLIWKSLYSSRVLAI